GGTLADRLRSAGARLELTSSALADLQAFNNDVINSLPSGLVTTDPAHRILTFNHAAEAITGIAASAAVGQPVVRILQLPARIAALFSEGLREPGLRRLDWRFRTDDGRGEIPLGLSATNLQTPGGRPGLLITFQDLTEIRKLERDVQIKQRLAA